MSNTPRSLDPAVQSYYDAAPEEHRLQFGPGKLEELRTRELIGRHAPPSPAVVFDVGGAAGAYSFWLAERGYEVHLVDASSRLVDVARDRNTRAQHPLASCEVGDARELSANAERADIVLLLGPLYHLVAERDRSAALSEAFRVLRPGGVLIAAGISRAASTLDGLSRDLFADPDFATIAERDLTTGHHRNTTNRVDYFTTAYLHRPEDLRREVTAAGFDSVEVYGVEGPGWILPDFDARWNDAGRRETLLRVARALETEPSTLGSSAHLIVAGRKP